LTGFVHGALTPSHISSDHS